MKFDYDILIIGGGSAGITSAMTAIGFGKRVAIIEKINLVEIARGLVVYQARLL